MDGLGKRRYKGGRLGIHGGKGGRRRPWLGRMVVVHGSGGGRRRSARSEQDSEGEEPKGSCYPLAHSSFLRE